MQQIFIPKWGGRPIEKELRFGTWLRERLERERLDTRRRMIRAAAPYRNVTNRQVGELTLTGVIDARTFFRWMQVDRHFWDDKGNWKRFVRDNPEVQPWK
jgi:hypothetical protein